MIIHAPDIDSFDAVLIITGMVVIFPPGTDLLQVNILPLPASTIDNCKAASSNYVMKFKIFHISSCVYRAKVIIIIYSEIIHASCYFATVNIFGLYTAGILK